MSTRALSPRSEHHGTRDHLAGQVILAPQVERILEAAEEVAGEDLQVYARLCDQRRWWTDRPFAREALSLGVRSGCALDMGCGPGHVATYLARFAPELRVWALDISPGMAEQVRRNAGRAGVADRIVTQTADMRALPYPDDSFDLVVSQYALHHLPNYETAFAEMVRVVRSEGAIFVRDLIRPRYRFTVELLVGVFGTVLGYDAAAREQYRDSLLAGFAWDDIVSCADRFGLRASRRSLSHFIMMRKRS